MLCDPLPVRLYEPDDSLPEKIAKVAAAMYGVEEIDSPAGSAWLRWRGTKKAGFGQLPICVAKSQYSFSGNANEAGKARSGKLVVRDCCSC
ncbi:MAG: formate--tetrahydrofolate ligase [Thermomicrobiales bacterium]